MKTLLTLLLSFLMCTILYAEKILVGTSPFNPPLEIQATKNVIFTGFEIDLLNEVCRRINATCVYEPMTFKNVMIATLDGTIDLGINGFFITKERMAYYLFSQPYLQAKAQLFTTLDSNINNTNVNNGNRIGVEEGTVFKSILLQMYNNITVIEYNKQQDMLQDLADYKIDLIMFDFIGASYWVNTNPGSFKLVGNAIPCGMGYGIMANPNRGALMARVNKALKDMESDGAYLAIYSRYF